MIFFMRDSAIVWIIVFWYSISHSSSTSALNCYQCFIFWPVQCKTFQCRQRWHVHAFNEAVHFLGHSFQNDLPRDGFVMAMRTKSQIADKKIKELSKMEIMKTLKAFENIGRKAFGNCRKRLSWMVSWKLYCEKAKEPKLVNQKQWATRLPRIVYPLM